MMWLSQKTYLRLLQDVYIAQQSESEDDVTLDTSKLNKLIAYLKQCPKRLTNVCRTLYHNIKKNYHTRTEKQKKRSCVLSADFLIFQELCQQCQEEGMSAVIALYFSRSIELLMYTTRPHLLMLVTSSFQCYTDHCRHTVEVAALAAIAADAAQAESQPRAQAHSPAEQELASLKTTLLLTAITTLSKAGEEAFTPHIATISVFLFRAFNNHKTLATEASTSTNTNTSTRNTRRAVFLQEALVTLCATPVPGVFTRVVSAFLHEFNHTHWLAVDAIEHVLEVLIRVASDKLRHQTKISSSLLTHVHNTLAESSLLFHSSASKSCVFTPSIGRLTSKLTLGSEQSLRQFSNKCDILERILQFALTSLKFENSFQSYHPYRSLFEQDWANLLRVVIYCVQHEDKRAEAQIMHSALSEEVHKHAAVLRPVIYVDPSVNSVGMSGLNPADDPFSPSTSSLVPRILHLVLECMHELVKSSAACAASSVLAIHKILAELGRNDIAHHSRRGSVLSRKIRVMLLFYLNAVTEWLVRPHSNPLDMASNTFSPLALPPVCLSRGLTNMQLCQACVYVRSEDRSTQHLAGMFLQRLMDAEPRIQPTHSNKSKSRPCLGIASPLLLGTALVAHGEQGQGQGQGQGQLAVRLLRNTIFNVLVRQGERTGLHGLRVILAWELQKKMIQTFSMVGLLSSLPMIFSLEAFWTAYSNADCDSKEDGGEEELKHEMLHNLVMFVCTFFRFVDQELHLQGTLMRQIDLFAHLDRFGSTLLYENECLFVKAVPRRTATSRTLNFQLPRPLNVDAIRAFILEQAVALAPQQMSARERALATEQVMSATYTPVESPYELLASQSMSQ